MTSNLKKLEVEPKSIREIFISHNHADHTGGLSAFLEENNRVKVWVPPSFTGGKDAKEVVTVRGPTELHHGIYSTGQLENIEQSLCVETAKGIVIVAGCSHPQMKNILTRASQFGEVYGIVGGLHGTKARALEGLSLICPTHCTQHKTEIKRRYPEQYVKGGAGRVIEVK